MYLKIPGCFIKQLSTGFDDIQAHSQACYYITLKHLNKQEHNLYM